MTKDVAHLQETLKTFSDENAELRAENDNFREEIASAIYNWEHDRQCDCCNNNTAILKELSELLTPTVFQDSSSGLVRKDDT